MRCAIYTRISDDTVGLGLGVARQELDCRALAQRLDWEVVAVYCDNDTSAYSGRPRPGYERMLTDLEAGRIGAVVCWDVDRLTRSPIELERVIDLAERHSAALASVGGEIDLATPQGRLTSRIKASVARHELEQSSRRIRRKVLERAEAGEPHGRVAYGWIRVSGRDVLAPDEAEVVRELAHLIVGGMSMRSITADLNRRGISTPTGKGRWHPVTVRQLVLRERNAGLRRHQRRVIGPGNWEPIFDQDVLERVKAVLTDPTRRSSPTGARRHLLSGIARCGICGDAVRILAGHGSRPKAYVCPTNFCVRRKQVDVDSMITQLVVSRLGQPDALQAFVEDETALPAKITEMQALKAKLDLAADKFAEGSIEGHQLARITAKLRPQMARLEAEIRQSIAGPDVLDLATPDIANRWDDIPLERQRAVIDLLMTITIKRVGKGGLNTFDPSGVHVEWRAGGLSPGGNVPVC
ncbi:MAG: recombinase family protein [Mycobacteriales bacterium]